MAAKYTLTVKKESKNYGNVCVFQTMPDQPDNILSQAWFSKEAQEGTVVEFEWTTDYNFAWSEQGELKSGVTFSEAREAEPDKGVSTPQYWAAFGDVKAGDVIEASVMENAVQLNLEDSGKTIVVKEDNSISIM